MERFRGSWQWMARGVGCLGVGALIVGCAALPPRSFLDPTKVGTFPRKYQQVGIRRVLTPLETPPGLENATEPTPEDLVPQFEDYRIGKSDQIRVVIEDFPTGGVPYDVTREVSPTGYIRIARLGAIKVEGLTEAELEQELRVRLQEAGLLKDPIVQVFTQVRRSKFFSILGGVGQPGSYPIARPDLRLMDVLGLVGGIDPQIRKLYIIRRTEPALPGPTPQAPATPAVPPQSEPSENELIIPPPQEPGSGVSGGVMLSADETFADPNGAASPPAAPPSSPQTRPFAPLIFDPATGRMREAQPPSEAAPPPVEPARPAPAPATETSPETLIQEPFDWEQVPEFELTQRVIEIDVQALKRGDPRYNVVIRDRDVIHVPQDTGVFYVMGQVNRPGVFAFGGREITVKQALATVGGFSALAWPARCEIIRREPGTDREIVIPVNLDMVFAGRQDDILLRDGDILNVGSDFLAPFLFVIRNSFRFTYGFGFVYDRNFADIDSFGGKINPDTVRRQRRAQLGLPF